MSGSQSTKLFHKHCQWVAGAGIGGMFIATILPHTWGLNKYRSFLAQYKDGKEESLSNDINNLSDQVLQDIYLKAEDEANLQLFPAYGNEMYHKGSLKLKSGAIIGIPATFVYKSVDDVQMDKMQIRQKPINPESEISQTLFQSLILSDEAKKFAIAREVYYANTNYVLMDAGLKSFFALMAYSTGFFFNNKFLLKDRLKTWGRVGVYAFIAGCSLTLYKLSLDTYSCHRDDKADRQASKLGENYAKGGVEFYDKTLQRNKALRSLMGPEGEHVYTLFGNEIATWWRPHVQLTVRKDNLIKWSQEYTKNVDS